MTGTEVHATSQLYWIAALVTALIDIAFVALLVWRVKPVRFRQVKWPLVVVALVFWISLWSWVMWDPFVWETCFQYVFSPLARWVWPPIYGLVAGGIALFLWWLAGCLPGNPIFNFLLLGGLESFPGHLWAMYGRKLMETPLLKEVSIASALVFGFFEFIFYWSLILTLASLANWIGMSLRAKRSNLK